MWERQAPLRRIDWEQIRRYPYYTRRLLDGTALAGIGVTASMVQERLDGSGYHRGLPAA